MSNTRSLRRPGIILVLLLLAAAHAAFAKPPTPFLVLRSGNGLVGGTDSQITFEAAPLADWSQAFPNKFTAADFAAASSGSAAWIVFPDGPWTKQLPGDNVSQWVGPLSNEQGQGSPTALYAIKFNMPSVPPVVTLVLHFLADNQLGDSQNSELYLNGTAVPGTNTQAGTYNNGESILTVPNIAALLKTGSNTLYINDVNTGGPSALSFRAEFYGGDYDWSNYAGNPGITGTLNATGTAALFNRPGGIAVDGSGNAYVSDTVSDTIRVIGTGGVVMPLAGIPGTSGTSDGTGTAALFNAPAGVAVDGSGNVYVADQGNNTIREIAPGGLVTTIAGLAGVSGTTDATGTAASFNSPAAVAVDGNGNLYVADQGNDTIREIAPGGAVTTIAGLAAVSGTANGSGTSAQFNAPCGIAVDGGGNIYVADGGNHTIRKISSGTVTTISGSAGLSGTADGYQSAASFSGPNGISVDHNGDLFIADGPADTIREMTPDGTVATLGGSPQITGTVGGLGSAARFNAPAGVAVDYTGNLYVADSQNSRIAISAPVAPPFALIAPTSNSTQNAPLDVSFSLPSQALSGSVKLTFDNGSPTPTVLTLASNEEAAGPNTIDFDPTDPADSSAVVSVSGTSHNSGGTAYIPAGVYTVTLNYKDQYGDPVQTAASTNVQITDLAVPSLSLPASNSTVSSLILGLYTLPGRALAHSVSLTFSGTGSPIIYNLDSNGESEGQTFFGFDPLNPPSTGYIASSSTTALPIGVYNVYLTYQDYAGDPVTSASATSVYFAPVQTLPATNVNSYSAQLNGQALSSFFESATSVAIESGTSTSYGTTTPVLNSGSSGSSVACYVNLTGLSRSTTYHYQMVMVNNGTTYYGGDETVTTALDDSPSIPNPVTFYMPSTKKPVVLNILSEATPGNPFDTLAIQSVGAASAGTVRISGSGAGAVLVYTPTRFVNSDSFNCVIAGNFGATTTVTVILQNSIPQMAGTYQTVVYGDNPGYLTMTLGSQGTFTGSLRLGGKTYSFTGALAPSGNATIVIPRKNLPAISLNISIDTNNGGELDYSVSIPGSSAESGTFTPRIPYSKANPSGQAGTYTLVIDPPSTTGTAQAIVTGTSVGGKITAIDVVDGGAGYETAPTFAITGGTAGKGAVAVAVLSSSGSILSVRVTNPGKNYTNPVTVTVGQPSGNPQGYGWATVKISNLGVASISGKLADGTPFTAGAWVDPNYYAVNGYYQNPNYYADPDIPIYSAPYGSGSESGYLAGLIYISTNGSTPTIYDSGSLSWYKNPQLKPQLYQNGFDVQVSVSGAIYGAPTNNYPIDLASGTGNAVVQITGGAGNLNMENTLTIPLAPATAGVVVSGSADSLKIKSSSATGVFTGKFTPPGAKGAAPFSGVYLQTSDAAYGFFSGTTQTGTVVITPAP